VSKRAPTERQLQIATVMLRYFDEHGAWPTQREVADEIGLNTTNMSPYFSALIKKGIAEKLSDRQRRNIGISKAGEELIRSGWQPSLPL
jgi:predicted transcriptional regulator